MDRTALWTRQIERFSEGALSVSEIRAWQTQALRDVLAHVERKSPFYRRRLEGLDVSTVGVDDLSVLPFTTKADLAEAMYDIVCGDVRDALYFYSTTGTTGRPTPCPRAPIDVDLNNVSSVETIRRIMESCFGPGHKPIMGVLPPNELHSVCMNMSFVARELGICKFDAFPLSPVIGFERLFNLLLELRVEMLLGSPGLVMALAEMAYTYGVDPKVDLNVKCILCTGELCSPSMTRLIADAWGARAYNYMYGSQEAGCIAVADVDGRMTPLLTNYIFEVIDLKTGTSLGNEGYGELCITMLVPGMKPLIRYRTGDLVRIQHGSTARPVIEVLGRVKDMLQIGGRTWSASEIDRAVLAEHREIFGYELKIEHVDGADSLLVRVKATDDADHEEIRRGVSASVREVLGLECKIELLPILDLKSATGGWVSWKSSRVTDLRVDNSKDIEVTSSAALARAAQSAI
jgi:phenylacetate-CoA ligase